MAADKSTVGNAALWLCVLVSFFLRTAASSAPSCDVGDFHSLAIGDAMKFCVFLSTKPAQKMVFQAKVEESAQFLLKGSQQLAFGNMTSSVYTWVAKSHKANAYPLDCANHADVARRGDMVSCPQIYATSERTALFTNLVVNLKNGEVSSFAWDTSCSGCAPNDCMEGSKHFDLQNYIAGSELFSHGTCGQQLATCAGNQLSCDLKVFVTWAGTDRHGQNLLSAGMRLSKLTGPTLSSLFNTMQQGYEKALSKVSG
eukprot:TRINITY_DN37660_c0_g1_i1.p1 TRINITY_DN37660_c0_g1~~TRINITY_DN37660_c0_g1_i1.p1  ORF type:complete len:256 (+),score=23.62 TRINITY_DN37660_c0_g1_i1:30-797(+)